MAAKSFDDATEQAKKVFGDHADIPPPKNDPEKLRDSFDKAAGEFDGARDTVEAKLLAMENAISTFKNGMKQNAAIYERANFGLNDKSKDDAKKIKLAQKIFSDYFTNGHSRADRELKMLDELDKHVIQLGKYKPSL
jgi:hypothetical protein